MPKSIYDRLPCNEINLIPNQRAQLPRVTLGDHAEIDIPGQSEFFVKPRKSLLQAFIAGLWRAQGSKGVASFFTDLLQQLKAALNWGFCRRICRQTIVRQIEMDGSAENPLQECVVQVARDSLALLKTFRKAGLNARGKPAKAKSIEQPENTGGR